MNQNGQTFSPPRGAYSGQLLIQDKEPALFSPEWLKKFSLKQWFAKHNAEFIILLGEVRSGKSSLLESITDTSGHSGRGLRSVTQNYHVEKVAIEGKTYLFVDTPGFNDRDAANKDILRNIGNLIKLVKDFATISGVLYVHSMQVPSTTQPAEDLLKWLKAFCGDDYRDRVTFVTTGWDMFSEDALEEKRELLPELAQECTNALGQGWKTYHHGLLDYGTLHIVRNREERRGNARSRMSEAYGRPPISDPRIVQELLSGLALEDTTAYRIFQANGDKEGDNEDGNGWIDWLGIICKAVWGRLWRYSDAAVQGLLKFLCLLKEFLPPHTKYRPGFTSEGVCVTVVMPRGTEFTVSMGFDTILRINGVPLSQFFRFGFGSGTTGEDFPTEDSARDGEFRDSPDEREFWYAFEQAQKEEQSEEQKGSGWSCRIM